MLVTGVTEVSHLVSLLPQSWRSRDGLYRHSHSLLDLRPFPAPSAHARPPACVSVARLHEPLILSVSLFLQSLFLLCRRAFIGISTRDIASCERDARTFPCRLNVLHVVPINARTGNSIETETPSLSLSQRGGQRHGESDGTEEGIRANRWM